MQIKPGQNAYKGPIRLFRRKFAAKIDRLIVQFGEVDHAAPGIDDPGPPTAPVSAVDLGVGPPAADDEDPFLTELRKAMADDEPLGPRDEEPPPSSPSLFGDEDDRRRRFGRRR